MRTLQQLVGPAVSRTNHYKNRMEQLQVELQIAEAQKKSREEVSPQIPKAKEERRAALQKEIARLNEEIAREKTQYNERKTKFNEDKTKAEGEIAAEIEKYAADEIKVNNEIRELKRQLEELKVKEVIKHEINFIQGKILNPDVPNKTAFINIGSRERVVPGLKFLVGNRGVQGKFEYKAKIEVKKAWMTYCEVAIIESYDKDKPVVEGDHIVNPLFHKERPIVVAFVGEDRPLKLRYNVDEASRRIKEIGSEVRKEVTLDVDYVIFTEAGAQKTRESYDPYKKAVFLEIPIADATDIFRFLGD
jgi:multidrug efflux pump subunit AcrA (membrane-fusion protein)